jgi:signal transduction histidine kinase
VLVLASDGVAAPDVDYRILFEQAPVLFLLLDVDAPTFTILDASDAYLAATNTTRAIVGRGLFDVFPDNPEDPTADGTSNLRASLVRALASKQADTMAVQKYDIRTADGAGFEERHWSPINTAVCEHGAVRYLLHRVTDVTDLVIASRRGEERSRELVEIRRELEMEEARARRFELESDRKRLTEASRLKSEFIAGMSHELRTPLNAIIGFTTLLHDGAVGPLNPQQQEFVGDVAKSSQHLLGLINGILDLAKVEAGRLEFIAEPVELDDLVAEVRQGLLPLAIERGVELGTDIAAGIGPVVLDRTRLKQVLYNYASNGIKFTPAGGRVTLRIRAEDEHRFRVEVEDTGSGIGAGDLPRLFTEFQQLDAGRRSSQIGSGLGLALTKRLVEAQGGSVGVDSAPGRGSTFHAVLPRRCEPS